MPTRFWVFFTLVSSLLSAVGGFLSYPVVVPLYHVAVVRAATLFSAPIVRAVDGDTIRIDPWIGPQRNVRLLGIDTPEKNECFYAEAAGRAAEMVKGRRATVEFGRDVFDENGRLLGYVHLDTGLFLNKALVEEGVAENWSYRRKHAHHDAFSALEERAKAAHKGRWGACGASSDKRKR